MVDFALLLGVAGGETSWSTISFTHGSRRSQPCSQRKGLGPWGRSPKILKVHNWWAYAFIYLQKQGVKRIYTNICTHNAFTLDIKGDKGLLAQISMRQSRALIDLLSTAPRPLLPVDMRRRRKRNCRTGASFQTSKLWCQFGECNRSGGLTTDRIGVLTVAFGFVYFWIEINICSHVKKRTCLTFFLFCRFTVVLRLTLYHVTMCNLLPLSYLVAAQVQILRSSRTTWRDHGGPQGWDVREVDGRADGSANGWCRWLFSKAQAVFAEIVHMEKVSVGNNATKVFNGV